MRTGLIILGIIFLVLGGILYFYPSQTFNAQTNVAPSGQNNVVNSSARFQIPVEWSFALSIIGGLFLFFGLIIPNHSPIYTQSISPAPTNTIIAGTPGPRGPRGSKGSKGTKGKTQRVRSRSAQAQTTPVKQSQRGTSVTTTTTKTTR